MTTSLVRHSARPSGDAAVRDVVVAAPYALLRDGLISILRERWPDWTFAQAADCDTVAATLAERDGALLVLDLCLAELRGIAGVQALCSAHPDCLCVVLGDSDERDGIIACLDAGARGYVLRSATPMQFLQAVETVLAGGVFAPASLAGRPVATPMRAQPAADPTPIFAYLTERQRDVFRLLAEGCATKTIARRLDLAVGTVKVHLAAIYRALRVQGRAEALAKVYVTGGRLNGSEGPHAGYDGIADLDAAYGELS